jgi:hypothetical protein
VLAQQNILACCRHTKERNVRRRPLFDDFVAKVVEAIGEW